MLVPRNRSRKVGVGYRRSGWTTSDEDFGDITHSSVISNRLWEAPEGSDGDSHMCAGTQLCDFSIFRA